MFSKAEKGMDVLTDLAENGGWDSVEEMAEEANVSVSDLEGRYFEVEEDCETEKSLIEHGGKRSKGQVCIIHKDACVVIYQGPGYLLGGAFYFDYGDNEV